MALFDDTSYSWCHSHKQANFQKNPPHPRNCYRWSAVTCLVGTNPHCSRLAPNFLAVPLLATHQVVRSSSPRSWLIYHQLSWFWRSVKYIYSTCGNQFWCGVDNRASLFRCVMGMPRVSLSIRDTRTAISGYRWTNCLSLKTSPDFGEHHVKSFRSPAS